MIQLIRERETLKREKSTAAAAKPITGTTLMIADCFCITAEQEGEQITRYRNNTLAD